MGEKLVDIKQGPIRVTIEANRKALAIFSQKEQNKIVRQSMGQVGNMWISIFLPKRFTDYARRFLRYNPRAAWEKAKQIMADKRVLTKNGYSVVGPQPTPLVLTGVMRAAALGGARGVPKATKSKAYVAIKIPLGHAVRKETSSVIGFIPPHEKTRIAEEFKRSLVNGINDAFKAGVARPPGRQPLSAAGRAANKERRLIRKFSKAGSFREVSWY